MNRLHIIVKHGPELSMPVLKTGEFGLTTDTDRLFIGSERGNLELVPLGGIKEYIKEQITALDIKVTGEISTLNVTLTASIAALDSKIDMGINNLNAKVDGNASTIDGRVTSEVSTINARITSEVSTLNNTITTKDSAQTQALNNHKQAASAHDVSNITNAESVTGSQTKADTALSSAKTYTDGKFTTHNGSSDHDGRYYTETEIDGKINTLNTAIGNKADTTALSGHTTSTTAHAAQNITLAAAGLVANNVKDAIIEINGKAAGTDATTISGHSYNEIDGNAFLYALIF